MSQMNTPESPEIALLQQRLFDMEARYHNDIQCRDALLETAKATIARQGEELAEAWKEARRLGEEYGISADYLSALICGVGDKAAEERDTLREGLERCIGVLEEAHSWIPDGSRRTPEQRGAKLATGFDVNDALTETLSAAQALLSGAANREPSAVLPVDPGPVDWPEVAHQVSRCLLNEDGDLPNHYVAWGYFIGHPERFTKVDTDGFPFEPPVEFVAAWDDPDSPTGTADDAIPSATEMVHSVCQLCGAHQRLPSCAPKCHQEHLPSCRDAIHTRTEPRPIQVGCEKFLQVEMFARGCVSGGFSEWPLLQPEVRKLLDSYTSQALEIASLRAAAALAVAAIESSRRLSQLERVEPENKL